MEPSIGTRIRDDNEGIRALRGKDLRYCYEKLELASTYSDIDFSAFRGARSRSSLTELVTRRHEYASLIVLKPARSGDR